MLHLPTYYIVLYVKKCKNSTEDIAVIVYVIIRKCPRYMIMMCLYSGT